MAQQNRNTLKHYFRRGALPSEKQFGDLIDSLLCILDDGFEKTAEHGLKIAAISDRESLIGFFRKMEAARPDWSMGIHPETGRFHIRNAKGEALLTLTPDGRMGIGCEAPECGLDIRGNIAMEGRSGRFRRGLVPADGDWHAMVTGLDGCQAFEIMAGAGRRREGRYALVQATALNTFKGKGTIALRQAHFDSRCNRIEFRWHGTRHHYRLEIRTARDYGADAAIRYEISRLWEDPFMENCHLDRTDFGTEEG